MENKHDLAAGCVDCPPCYDLVQDAVNHLRVLLRNLSTIIDNIGDNPRYVDDEAFERCLSEVNDSVNQLLEDARNALGATSILVIIVKRNLIPSTVLQVATTRPEDNSRPCARLSSPSRKPARASTLTSFPANHQPSRQRMTYQPLSS